MGNSDFDTFGWNRITTSKFTYLQKIRGNQLSPRVVLRAVGSSIGCGRLTKGGLNLDKPFITDQKGKTLGVWYFVVAIL